MQYGDARPNKFKVILLGESGVGKTSLFQRFRSRDIPSTPKSALMLDRYQYIRQFAAGPHSHPVQLELWDTANMERARSLTETYFRETAAILLVYDIADAVSLKRISYWQQEQKYHLPDASKTKSFLIGNKSDLEEAKYDSDYTTVSYAKEVIGKQCTDIINVFEVSAKEDHCVERMFHAVAEQLWQNYTTENCQGTGCASTSTVKVKDGTANVSSFRLVDDGNTNGQIQTTGKRWRCC